MEKESQKKVKQWKKSERVLDILLFAVPAGLVILGALIVIFAKNPVHNSMGLVLTLTSLAIIYITLNATFVAMVQMLVYAGAVMTLFLFVIMMIGVDKPDQTREEIKGQTLLVSGTLFILIGIISYVVIKSGFKWDLWFPAVDYSLEGTPDLIAGSLFTEWVLPFEMISILLIVATSAAIALAYDTKPKKKI
ncbi:NADH-quinone oxidoreductase subunit J [bacterium]|jgi:NADH-quinone oxidoreductase subunit J|nr:NADH-quinone oxidoreductase subunit J [bacterium]|tara:strand:+ start:7994 stop:8569 length:576 start_codon:yes stop_codon:yes gene_type:complete